MAPNSNQYIFLGQITSPKSEFLGKELCTKTISFIRYEKIHEKKKSQKNIRTIDYLLLRVPSELTNILRVRSVIFPLDIV